MLLEDRNITPPKSQTDLMHKTVLYFIIRDENRKQTRKACSGVVALSELPSTVYNKLLKLTEFAFQSTERGKYVFTLSELSNTSLDENHFGLLTSTKSDSLNYPGGEWHFTHASIQQFLAGYWIVTNDNYTKPSTLESLSMEYSCCIYGYDNLAQACSYAGGLLSHNASSLLTSIFMARKMCFCSVD